MILTKICHSFIWKGNEFCYPVVAAMARDILSIPVSTVAS
jgi:hypothetical protein